MPTFAPAPALFLLTWLLMWAGAACAQTDSLPPALPMAPSPGVDSLAKTKAKPLPRKIVLQGLPNKKLLSAVRNELRPVAADSAQLADRIRGLPALLALGGYATASMERPVWEADKLTITFVVGAMYVVDSLRFDGLNPDFADDLRLAKRTRPGSVFSWAAYEALGKQILFAYEAAGYPFARVERQGLQFRTTPDTVWVSVRATVVPADRVVIDSIYVLGNIREKPRFVQSLIRLQPGDVYNAKAIQAIPNILNNTQYYQNTQKPELRFADKLAVLTIRTERRRSNRFDGLLGLLPPKSAGEGFQFTGLLDLQLVSALRWGEVLTVHYEKLTQTSQRIDLSYQHPYLFGTPLRAEFLFKLLKQDTAFLTRTVEPAVAYQINPYLSARFYYRNFTSSVLNVPKASQLQTWPPPQELNGSSSLFGFGLTYEKLDYKPNPTRGLSLTLDGAFGSKTISKTTGLDSLDYTRLQTRQPRTEVNFQAEYYLSPLTKQVLLLRNRTYWLGLREYFANDQAFLGGARSLRGFNENEFLAAFYTVLTLEYRLLMDRDSFIGLFADYAYTERRLLEAYQLKLHPFGVGLTLAFKTPVGVVSVAYAVGGSEQQAFQVGRGRIHIGLVNQF